MITDRFNRAFKKLNIRLSFLQESEKGERILYFDK
jgi:hypothetical protein